MYLADIGVFSNTFVDHQILCDKVLSFLKTKDFTVKPLKFAWAIQETNWLGYWLTPISITSWKKHISSILEQQLPCNLKEMYGFLGAVNTYQLIWPKWAHLLTLLSDKSGKKTFYWTPEMDNVFKIMKTIFAVDVFMTYPNHNLPFHILHKKRLLYIYQNVTYSPHTSQK